MFAPLLLAATSALIAGQAPPGAAAPAEVPPAAVAVEKGPAPAPAADLAALLSTADAAWATRDQPGQLEVLASSLDAADKAAPASYAVLWRQARRLGWLAEDPKLTPEEKSRIGKLAWEAGDKASALEPGKVEGYFYAMSGVGNYSLGIGVVSALMKGIEGKFKERLARAEAIDPGFEAGAIPMSWGRLYFELPWPKHDARLSEKYLRESIARNAGNVRAHVYLADLLLDEGKKDEARAEYQRALDVPVIAGQGDPPEQRRWQVVARESLERSGKK
jgi:tetratricopeptide (TPR) repeat protein